MDSTHDCVVDGAKPALLLFVWDLATPTLLAQVFRAAGCPDVAVTQYSVSSVFTGLLLFCMSTSQ